MEERAFHPLDYLSVLRRRKWWLIVPFVVSLIAGAALALLLPKEYSSAATIGISSPAVSTDLVRPGTGLDRDERARAISQQLLSDGVLTRVVRDEKLGSGDVALVVNQLRANVKVTVPDSIGPANGKKGLDAFIITYTDRTPDLAQRVTNRLASVFVDESSRVREARAEDTSEFLAAQLGTSHKRLSELEDRLRAKKEAYMGRLPEQSNANLQMVSGLRQQLESTSTSLRGEQDRLSMIERQLEGLRQGAADVLLPKSSGAATGQARVLALQRQLAEARGIYTEKHPEIRRLQEELAAAAADAAAERQRPAADRAASLLADPGYRQLVGDGERARLRIRDLERAEQAARQQIAMYQSRVESAPMVEQELSALNRDYTLEKEQYSALSAKYKAALLSADLERQRGGEQFQIIYPAYLPSEPSKPNALRLLLMAALFGLFMGAGLAVTREYLDRSVYDARTLEQEFELPVLGEIPHIGRVA